MKVLVQRQFGVSLNLLRMFAYNSKANSMAYKGGLSKESDNDDVEYRMTVTMTTTITTTIRVTTTTGVTTTTTQVTM